MAVEHQALQSRGRNGAFDPVRRPSRAATGKVARWLGNAGPWGTVGDSGGGNARGDDRTRARAIGPGTGQTCAEHRQGREDYARTGCPDGRDVARKTAWDMLDAALDGNVRKALVELDRLLLAGENPVAILGQVAATLRRLAAATRLIIRAEATGQRISLREALGQAGVKAFVLEKTERQLRRLGRRQGDRLYRWLLEADMDLKGNSSLPLRTILERLFVRIAVPEGAK